jgi:predicted TIM-barrel fold metal-dependent hydrolase
MRVDFHCHIEPKPDGTLITPAEFLKAMDDAGIDKAVVLGVDHGETGYARPWSRRVQGPVYGHGWVAAETLFPGPSDLDDDTVAAFARSAPDRLIGFASVHPDRYRPDLKVRRAVDELGLRGVKLYPHAGFYPNDPRLTRMYEACVELRIPVAIHCGIKAVRWQHLKYNDPTYVDDVATDFPDLQVVMLHGGYPWVEQFIVVAYSNPNVWVDLTFLDRIALVFNQPDLVRYTVSQLVRLIGSERLLWGTEGPYLSLPMFGSQTPKDYAASIDRLVRQFDFLTGKDKENILGGNAVRLLGLA